MREFIKKFLKIGKKNIKTIKSLGKICVLTLEKNKIASVIKHIPGHGCANADSHKKLPKVNLNIQHLDDIDFFPFKNSRSRFAMTAHIVYSKIDNENVKALVTECEFLISNTGRILICNKQIKSNKIEDLPSVLIVLAKSNQFVSDVSEGMTLSLIHI